MLLERNRYGDRNDDRCFADNQVECSFSQTLCVKFDVIFTIDAEVNDVDVSCDG